MHRLHRYYIYIMLGSLLFINTRAEQENSLCGDNRPQYATGVETTQLIGGSDLGYYYITLYFGTSRQKQTLVVDTGSALTTVQCEGDFLSTFKSLKMQNRLWT